MLSVVAYVQANPGCIMKDVCEWLNYESKAHGYHVIRRAIREGLVVSRHGHGRAIRLFPNTDVSVEAKSWLLNTKLISFNSTGLCCHGPTKVCQSKS